MTTIRTIQRDEITAEVRLPDGELLIGKNASELPPLKSQPPKQDTAEHSPLPRLTEAEAKENMTGAYITLADGRTQYCEHLSERERQAVNNADKLADALRDCVTTPGALAERSHKYALRRLASITATASEALAEYQRSKGQ